jgi:hypothetical protein
MFCPHGVNYRAPCEACTIDKFGPNDPWPQDSGEEMLNDRRHSHVVSPKSQPFPPNHGEPMVSWMTNSGMIAIPESEAKMRREAMAAQLGMGNILVELEEMRSAIELFGQEIQMLKNLLGRVIVANDLVQTPR